ncbi:hypothetical protein RvY_03318 [Ramazzottius varieornatus]|uniref:EGF-like domain-containing protein n=1 Tax=Ramazzottius varieornatus TaxID=947166 RepID=A0A1D1URD6_RAMVA|nr:hypothetical protein RvY_03318 [Ramazzottius varieornatus]
MRLLSRMEVRLSALFLWRIALLLDLLDLGQGQFQEPLSRIRLARPIAAQIDCSSPTFSFHCLSNSNLCIRPESVRDGMTDCPDGSDEDVRHVNICDYAVHYSDYRCSRFADCLDRPSGYACQCKVGYIGPGDTCQPAPLNLPAVLHSSPAPLIIRTLKHDNNDNLQRGRPDLATLSHQILGRLHNLHPFNNFEATPSTEGGVRQQRQESSAKTPQTTLQVWPPPNSTMNCPAGTVMIKEAAQVWCLKINHGKIEFPPGVFTSDEARRAATQASFALAQASAAANQLNITSLHQQPDYSISGAFQSHNNQLDMWENPDTALGFHGYTDSGALYGYLPTSSPVQQQPLVLTDASDVSVADGSIITPVKVWNASGNAFTAYRIMPNVSLPPSCLRNPTSAKFMCADRTACLSPDRVLDGGEDCADGSDEVPEFIDECALGAAWPQYRCGQKALCTDSMKGYSCACFATYYWDQSGCVSSALLTSPTSRANMTYVSLESHPGYAVWKAGNNATNIFSSGVIRAANGTDPTVNTSAYRRPVTQCDDCINPLSVTMGPPRPLQEGRQDGPQTSLYGYRPAQFSFMGNAGSRLSPFAMGDTRADTGRTTILPGVTITGTYYPPEVTTRRTDQVLGYTLAGSASPVPQQGSSAAAAASRANLTVLSIPSSGWGYVGPLQSYGQGQQGLANPESQLMQPSSAGTSDQWSTVLDALRRGGSAAFSSTSRPPATASSAVTYVTNAAGDILNISTAETLFGRLPPTSSSNGFLQTAASALFQPNQPQSSRNNGATNNYAVLGNAASGYGGPFGGSVATTVLPFRQTSYPLPVATTRFSTQIPQILLGGFGGFLFGNNGQVSTGPAYFAASTPPPLVTTNSYSTSVTLSTLLVAVNTAPSAASTGDNPRPGDTLTDLSAAVAAGAAGAALASNSFGGASTRVPPYTNSATSTNSRPYVGAAARADTDSGQLNTTLSPVTIVLGNTAVEVASPPPLPAVEPLLPNGLINPAAYPTDRLWSPTRFRPGTAPLLQSLPPLLDNATSPEDLAKPLEQVYDCFGDLFRRAYSSLSNGTKACSQDCRDDLNEVCVRPAGRCDCREGTTRNSMSGGCELSFQYNVAVTMDQLCNQTLQFRPYLADLNNPSTQQLSVIVCYQMEELIRQSAIADRYGGGSCHPLGFSAGSVVSSVALSFLSTNTSQATLPFDLIRALADVLVRNQGLLAPTSFPSPALRVKAENTNNTSNTYLVNVRDVSECDLDAPVCDVNADCRNSFGSFACVCRPGFVDLALVFPGRLCGFPNQTTLLANGTILGCPSNYYHFATLCLHPAYYILLIIALVILGIVVLAILICLFAWCYRCCNDTESEYNAPQAALIRAAARSPRLSTTEAVTSQYQVLRSTEGRSSLEPPQPSAPYLGPSPNLGIERARPSSSKSPLQDNLMQTTPVQTWEEVEVPTTKEDDNVSRRALTPSVQSLREKSAQLEKHLEEERLAEGVTTQKVEDVKPADGIVTVLPTDGASIGSAHDIARTDFTFPSSPSTSMKAVSSAIHAAKRLRTEAREGIRKASSETRDWDAVPRTESLDVTEDQLDINTLPHNGYDKDPIFRVTAGFSAALLAEDRSSRMGLNGRDSLDDMMEQTGQFYPHSSSDHEYEKEDDLSKTRALPTSDLVISTNDGQRRESQLERQPAFVLVDPGASLDEATPPDLMSQDDDDHHSLRSTDEEELKRLNGSTQSLNSVKEVKRRSHDSVIDHMVEEQPAFYTNTDLEEEEEDKAENGEASQQNMLMLPAEEGERLPSAVQRDIAREFSAMGERDSIDDMLDHTSAFFSRASTLDSFHLPKSDSGGDIGESSTVSRKGSQNLSGESSDGSGLRLLPNGGLRKPLLKKRSAFYSRDSMNRIVENSSEISVNPEDGTVVQKTELKDNIVEGGSLDHESPAPSQRSLSQATLHRQAERFDLDLDDDDINEFFTETGTKLRPASASQVEEEVILRQEYLEESVLVHRTLSVDSVRERERDRDNQSLLDFERLEESVSKREVDDAVDFAIPEESVSPLREAETSSLKRDSLEEQAEVTRLQDLERPPSNISLSSPPSAKEMVTFNETVTERRSSLPDQDLLPSPTGKEETLPRNDPDNKSIKSVSDHNILNSLRDKNASPQLILHDTDSGVYVDTGQTDREGSAANRRRRPMSSQDDLRIFEGQEQRRQGSGSSYQRQSHSDEEEEEGVMKPYSTTSEVGTTARPHHKRLRNNYDMTAPESRHVYYSSRPKRMPPRQEESDIWANSTWWRLRK